MSKNNKKKKNGNQSSAVLKQIKEAQKTIPDAPAVSETLVNTVPSADAKKPEDIFGEDNMNHIRTPKIVKEENIEDDYEYSFMPKSHKKVQDIPIDDVLLDDYSDDTPAAPVKKSVNTAKAAEDDNLFDEIGDSTPKPEPKPAPVEETYVEAVVIPDEDIDKPEETEKRFEQGDENIVPSTSIELPPTSSKFAKKRLRKNLGLDDKLTVVKGNHATTDKDERKRRRRSYVDPEDRKKRIHSIIFAGIVVIAAYVGAFAVVNVLNKEYFTSISETLSVAAISNEPIIDADVYYIDSDKDGLSDDYELNVFKTDPHNYDSDNDGISDGDEYISKTDPLNQKTDGTTKDSERIFEKSLSNRSAVLDISGKAKEVNGCVLNEYKSLVNQYPGVISDMYEVTGLSGKCTLTIAVSEEELAAWGSESDNVKLYWLNTKNLSVNKVDGSWDGVNAVAEIKDNGVYFVADSKLFSMDAGIDVMFLIDNSGSMYSAELVNNSEENDLDFKRVTLSENLIKALDKKTNFGVAKFTATYTLLNAVSSSSKDAAASLAAIRTDEELFNGTEISNSIICAADAFTDNERRRYMIMITDGLPSVENKELEQQAIQSCVDRHISVIAISLGKKTDTKFLTEIAEKTDGIFFQAINVASFDSIEKKIKEYMYIQREEIDAEDGSGNVTLSVIADNGFSTKDCLAIGGVPTTKSIIGSPVGSAVINKLYYSGKIPLANSYYNLVDSEFFVDGKGNLCEYEIPSVAYYNDYLKMNNKWNFSETKSSMLQFTDKTKSWLSERPFKTIMTEYNSEVKSSDTLELLRTITFQQLPKFDTYEKAVIDVESLSIPEKQIYYAASYYDNFKPQDSISFGYSGDEAFNLLMDEIGRGVPSVLIAEDNTIYNAIKISRNAQNPNEYIIGIIDACDVNKTNCIYLTRQEILNQSGSSCQYIAKKSGSEIKLYILKT